MSIKSKGLLLLTGVAVFGTLLVLPALGEAPPPAPIMGMNATLIDLNPSIGVPAPEGIANRGLRVHHVTRGTPAAHLGLERGDILVSVDSMRFTTYAGFQHALRCSGDRPSFIIIDVNTGRLLRRATNLPHQQPEVCEPIPPESYWMSIDLVGDMTP
jgi:hypothetical protein